MHDKSGKIIYVGKSKALHNRLGQYFSPAAKNNIKTEHMVRAVYDFEYIITDTEIEALALENKLIKVHSPKYNIRLKDSKSYPYIKVNVGERYPSITVTRTRRAIRQSILARIPEWTRLYYFENGSKHIWNTLV